MSLIMLSLDTAYRSFGGEVEASSTPTICRLPDSRRHQLSAIAPPTDRACDDFTRLRLRVLPPGCRAQQNTKAPALAAARAGAASLVRLKKSLHGRGCCFQWREIWEASSAHNLAMLPVGCQFKNSSAKRGCAPGTTHRQALASRIPLRWSTSPTSLFVST